jgi:CBS domain-containing protein
MMTEDPVTIDADADVRAAARVISERRHNRVPVVEHGRYVGMISRADVLEALSQA